MSDERMMAIATKLLERTRKGDVGWSDTADEDAFTVAYPTYSVSLRKISPTYPVSLGTIPPVMAPNYYVLSVRNAYGSEIESLPIRLSEDGFETLRDLFQLAKRIALKADEVLDDLLGRLSKEEASA